MRMKREWRWEVGVDAKYSPNLLLHLRNARFRRPFRLRCFPASLSLIDFRGPIKENNQFKFLCLYWSLMSYQRVSFEKIFDAVFFGFSEVLNGFIIIHQVLRMQAVLVQNE